jgi:hypothetical protein
VAEALERGRAAEKPTPATRDGLFRQCFVDLDGLAGQLGGCWAALAAYGPRLASAGDRPRRRRPVLEQPAAFLAALRAVLAAT